MPTATSPNSAPTSDAELAGTFGHNWLHEAVLEPIEAMNSSTWAVRSDGKRYILEIMARDHEPGLKAAAWLESHGLRAGAPIRTAIRDGRLVALLTFVDGDPLTAESGEDVEAIGSTLARAHRLLRGSRTPRGMSTWPWRWLDPLVIEDHALRAAATAAIERAEGLAPRLTQGILHGDPAPEAFLRSGQFVAIIDWGAACYGPLLYDVASAVMYAGPGVVDAYRQGRAVVDAELGSLDVFVAFRWAVQAWYFSSRIERGDLTGLTSTAENEKGLNDARRNLLVSPDGSRA